MTVTVETHHCVAALINASTKAVQDVLKTQIVIHHMFAARRLCLWIRPSALRIALTKRVIPTMTVLERESVVDRESVQLSVTINAHRILNAI